MNKTSFTHFEGLALGSALFLMQVLSATAAPQNLIQNGSFESPAQKNPGTYAGVVPTGWTFNDAGPNTMALLNGDVAKTPGPFIGSQFLFLSDLGGIRQNVTVPSAGTYVLGLVAAAPSRASAGSLFVDINNTDDKFIAQNVTSTLWAPYSIQVSLAAGANQIYVQESSQLRSIYVDDVSLYALPDTVSTWFIGGLAFGLLIGLRSRITSNGGTDSD
jgi:hypothetical protein